MVFRHFCNPWYLPAPRPFTILTGLHLANLVSTALLCTVLAGFQYLTETFVALQRIDKFLGMPEPPPAVHMRSRQQQQQPQSPAARSAGKANPAPAADSAAISNGHGSQVNQEMSPSAEPQSTQQQPSVAAGNGSTGAADNSNGVLICDLPDGYVELGGAEYDWIINMQDMASQVGELCHCKTQSEAFNRCS